MPPFTSFISVLLPPGGEQRNLVTARDCVLRTTRKEKAGCSWVLSDKNQSVCLTGHILKLQGNLAQQTGTEKKNDL